MTRAVRELQAELGGLVGARVPAGLPGRDVVALAERNGVAALLRAALNRSGRLPELPPTRREKLEQARRREVAQQMRAQGHAELLIEELERAGVAVIALKGLALHHALYAPQAWVRAPGDLDLMVAREDFPRVRELFDALDYRPYQKHPEGFYRDHHHMRPHYPPGDRSMLVDVHWTPIGVPNPFRVDLGQCWSRAVELVGPESPLNALRLDDVDQAAHLILQIDFDDAYGGKGRSLFDLAAWIVHRRVDPHAVRERTAECGGGESFARVSAVLNRCFGLDLGARPAPRSLPDGAWLLAVEAALWLPPEQVGIPVWYRQHLARALTEASGWPQALKLALDPVRHNWRLGGEGYERDAQY